MKKIITSLFLALSAQFLIGQNIGINTSSPQTTLDLKGGFRIQPLYLTGSGTSIIIPDNQSNINLEGTFTGPFSASINTPQDGQKLTIDNNSNQTGTLIGGPDIRSGLNEYIHSNGEWKTVKTNAWDLNGNYNTNPTTNFIGTIDKRDLVFKTYNNEAMRIHQQGGLSIGTITHTEALDLNGNANISGEIMPLGVAGAANQVLRSNGNGTMSWATPSTSPITVTDTLTLSAYGLVSDAIWPPFEINQTKFYGYPTTGGQGLYYAPIVFPVSKVVINQIRAYLFDNSSSQDIYVDVYSAPLNSITISDRVSVAPQFTTVGQSSIMQEKTWSPATPYPIASGKNTYFFRVRTLSSIWPADDTIGFRALRIVYSYTI